MHQAKHTLRQKQKVEDLEAGIARLQDKIQQLNDQRRIVSASIVTNTSAWSVAAEYFRLMHSSASPSGGAPTMSLREFHEQRDFFLATMAHDVVGDRGFGSSILEDLHIELECLDSCDDSVLIAYVESTATLTVSTLLSVSPRLTMHGSVRFQWSSERSRVVGLHFDLGMLTPIFSLLGNLEDTAPVFHGALLTPDSNLASLY
ncbi:hypothetical protein PHYSODRAFT_312173 [Phytophthora sojae]|uniref:Uncharacterized protein n=1 Tax=Phytophthora sojae (strain P6497) TaxID=1094619 RepID=G4YUQ6_PHYSP|nr:hypothetical protein PHYSODRAFT_312173 [Phytophthora sojae]EGZ25981.1 hypothetical protein PHYSODRAFT_312173 [Phytophthora sojae]|eukprot:XP_009521269.1 hypothetical protein PHYSODRAFT_312173 [Phytophthora sojae]